MLTIVLIAIALSLDAMAVSVTAGMKTKSKSLLLALKLGLVFGFFQILMPLIGYFVGSYFKDFIEFIDHWIAFILLTVIGLKMIKEAVNKENSEKEFDGFDLKMLLILAIATSIDALAAGVTFVFMDINLPLSLLIIFSITFILCFIGTIFGKLINRLFDGKMEVVGGLVLIGIGTKILIEHLFF